MTDDLPRMPSASELEHLVRARQLPADPIMIEATEAQRAQLAKRFDITAIKSLRAEIDVDPDDDREGAVRASGLLEADIVQACAVSGEDFPVAITEPLDILFVSDAPQSFDPDEEVELDADDCDEIAFTGDSFDLGEAVAQSLALAIDPYAIGPDADVARKEAGLMEPDTSGTLAAALMALKDK